MAGVHGDCKRLWCDYAPETAFRGVIAVVVQAVGIVHGLYPAADIIGGNRVIELGAPNLLAKVLIQVGCVESLVAHGSFSRHEMR